MMLGKNSPLPNKWRYLEKSVLENWHIISQGFAFSFEKKRKLFSKAMKTNHNAEFGTVFFGAKIQMPDDKFE